MGTVGLLPTWIGDVVAAVNQPTVQLAMITGAVVGVAVVYRRFYQ